MGRVLLGWRLLVLRFLWVGLSLVKFGHPGSVPVGHWAKESDSCKPELLKDVGVGDRRGLAVEMGQKLGSRGHQSAIQSSRCLLIISKLEWLETFIKEDVSSGAGAGQAINSSMVEFKYRDGVMNDCRPKFGGFIQG